MQNKIITTARESEKGVVLLVTILLLAAIMLISFAVATLARRDIRAAGDMLRGEAALYAADSGIEEVLYRLKRGESLDDIQAKWDGDFIGFDDGIANLDYLVTSVGTEVDSYTGSLVADESAQIDVVVDSKYDIANDIFISPTQPINEIFINWTRSSDNAWLEWTIVRWSRDSRLVPFNISDFEDDPDSDFNSNEKNVTLFKGLEPPSNKQTNIKLTELDYSDTKYDPSTFNYILRLKALYGNVVYTVTTNVGKGGLPGIIGIQAIGRRGENKRALEISVNQTRGALGFLDYVLYSDETISKY